MEELIQQWRTVAACNIWSDVVREVNAEHADELEMVWHDYFHDAEWSPHNCPICRQEMKDEGLDYA
jgi:hypothetical protein